MHAPHKIAKLILEVSMKGDENHVRMLQTEIEQIVSKYIAEALDPPLTSFDTKNIDFIIDKLEIDIGSFELKGDKGKLLKVIAEKVGQELHKISKNIEVQNGFARGTIKTKSFTELEVVFYILRNGHIPWWADSNRKVNVNDFFKRLIQKPSKQQIIGFKEQLFNPVFRRRLINYLTEVELIGCVSILIPSFIGESKLIVDRCKTSSLFKEHFFDLLFELPSHKNNASIEEITESMIQLFADYEISPQLINLEVLPISKDILSRLKLMQRSTQKTKQGRRQKTTQTEINIEDETENSIEISNAGLVLVLSFLSRFFENIGIAKNKEFNSLTEQHYAVYLLHYMATGNLDLPQEHELFFEKLICGIEVNEILEPYSEFKQSHLDEVEELLKSVIENWKALKNSSPQTLQSAFLQRPGYLIQRDDGAWSLHIERQTIDILLNKLPWTISMSRLPFSNMMIYTEW